MFKRVVEFLESLGAGEAERFGADDRNLAIAALFHHMIAVDGVIKPIEKVRFNAVLEEKFGLTSEKLLDFSARASHEGLQSSSLFPFTSIINRECSRAEKIEIVTQLEMLARSDGEWHPLEAGLVKNVAELLKVSPVEAENAKKAAWQ